ncbi:MAG: hypothetical protein WA902_18310, partial [Thermosynechococcaceae cyanobacterium]
MPPNDENGAGEGFVSYEIKADRNIETGAVIDAEARIIFDQNEPIDTPPIFNTLDADGPTSTVAALPTNSESSDFTVQWNGEDAAGGSAIASYTLYVSDNGGAFTPWLENTTLNEATFTGEFGHTYEFYSIARD